MRASTASMILAFCAMLAVQATPSDFQYDSAGNEIEQRGDFEYDAAGNEIEKRGNWEYDAQGNESEKREPKKKAKKVSYFHHDLCFPLARFIPKLFLKSTLCLESLAPKGT
jgi:hypothetical protein